jgi:hypothetical protein
MNLVPASATRALGMTVLKGKKNSPHIFFGLGLLGAIGSVILACRATLDLEETLDEVRADIEEANAKANEEIIDHFAHGNDQAITPEVIDRSERERYKEVSVITVKGVVAVGKLYGPSVILGGISVACLAGSHVQMTRRNAALAAAFTSLTKAYDDYRARVRAEIGEEKELDIYRGIETVEITNEKGKKELVRAVNPDGRSIYSKCFDEYNENWKNHPEFNRTFLTMQEKWANQKLLRNGYLFLNDVYQMLGFPETSLGQVTGWIANSEVGDGFVDFGMFDAHNTRFMNALEPSIWLDFNVDGEIYRLLP